MERERVSEEDKQNKKQEQVVELNCGAHFQEQEVEWVFSAFLGSSPLKIMNAGVGCLLGTAESLSPERAHRSPDIWVI